MKRRILALTLAAALALICAACTPAGETPEDTTPAETGNTAPTEYDFSGAVLDEYTETLTGFGGLPYGYVLPQETADALATEQNETITLTTVEEFAGLTFRMERIFSYTGSIPGLGEGQRALTMGQYTMTGFLSPDDPEGGTATAVAWFDQTLAYLTELYGQPDSYTLSGDDEELAAPLTAEQYTAEGVTACTAAWTGLENGQVTLRLADSYGLSLTVTFAPSAETLRNAGQTAGLTLSGMDAPGLAADVAGFEDALWGTVSSRCWTERTGSTWS